MMIRCSSCRCSRKRQVKQDGDRSHGKTGLAFQIQDDILDVTSTTELLGKPVHSDEKNEKTTYVTWKGIEKAHEDVERLTQEAVDLLRKFPAKDDFLEELLKSLVYREK